MRGWLKNLAELANCLRRLRPHLRGGRYLIAAVVATSLCAAVLEGVGVSLLVPLLSLLLGGEEAAPMRPIRWVQTWIPGHGPAFYVVLFCLFVLGAILAKNLIFYGSQILAARLKRRITINLRDSLYQRLHQSDLYFFERRTAGELANVFLTETQRTISLLDYLLLVGQRASIACFYLVALLVISWPLTAITLLLAGFIGSIIAFLTRRLHRAGSELTERNQKLGSSLLETFGGIRVIRASGSQAWELARFHGVNEAQAEVEERSARAASFLPPFAETLAVAGAMVIVGCAYFFLVKPGLMLASHLLGFGFILIRLLPLLNQIYALQGFVFYLAGSLQEVGKWLESPSYPQRAYGKLNFSGVRESIRLENVAYTYPNGAAALSGVSFEVPGSKTVALVGMSGSGKSTIASLLLRFRHPSYGRILVDGRDYWEFSAESWHRGVAVVEQEAFLFHDTMSRNIAYGCPGASLPDIQQAVQQAHLEDVVAALPDGLNTIVGERGMMLSGGQRQRLAIARAMVRKPQLLILDEATSALDSISERQVQAALEEAQQGRTVLIIAHRLSTIRHADHIVVLQGGQVVEQGTWDELQTLKGVFAELVHPVDIKSGLVV